MHFKVDLHLPLHQTAPELSLVPALEGIPERILKWTFLVYDFKSPYRKVPIEERKLQCALLVGFLMEKSGERPDKNTRLLLAGKNENAARAHREFMALQADEDRELYLGYQNMLRGWTELMNKEDKSDKDLALLAKVAKELPIYLKVKKELALIVGDEAPGQDAKRSLSTIDRMSMAQQQNP
jgi:hypothetical protein